MSAAEYLFQFGNTKEEINRFTELVQAEVIDGQIDPHKFAGIISALVKGLTKALEYNQENLPPEKHEAYGFEFTPKEAGVRYDFSNCNHPKLNQLTESKQVLEVEIKEIQTTLKTLTKPTTIVDDDSGEVVQINPPIKKSKSIVEVR